MKTWIGNGILATLLLALAACGGGGDGDDSGGDSSLAPISYTGPTATITLDRGNAGTTANAAWDNVGSLNVNTEMFMVAAVAGAGKTTSPAKASPLAQARKAVDAVRRALQNGSGGLLTGVVTQQTIDCDAGNMTITANQNVAGQISVGDTFTVEFNGCRMTYFDGTSTTDGTMSLRVTAVTGNPAATSGDYSLTGELSANVRVIDSTGTIRIAGSMMLFDEVDTGINMETSRVWGREFIASESSGTQFRLTNFDFTEEYATTSGARRESADFELASTEIGGSVTVETRTVFFYPLGSMWPTSGSLRVTGDGGAWVQLDAQSNGQNVDISWDFLPLNGDGSPDGVDTILWSDLPDWTMP